MAIRIPKAYTIEGLLVAAREINPDDRGDHYICPKCQTKLAFTKSHDRQIGEDTVTVPAFFRLLPRKLHARSCPFNLKEQVKIIAADSLEVGPFGKIIARMLRSSKYRFRLLALPAREKNKGHGDPSIPILPRNAKDPEYTLSMEMLIPYLSTARRVFELRLLCENNDGLAELLEVHHAGKVISWADVCLESDDYRRALSIVTETAGAGHPMALIGEVKKLYVEEKAGKKTHCLNMKPFRSRRTLMRSSRALSRASRQARDSSSMASRKGTSSLRSGIGTHGKARTRLRGLPPSSISICICIPTERIRSQESPKRYDHSTRGPWVDSV